MNANKTNRNNMIKISCKSHGMSRMCMKNKCVKRKIQNKLPSDRCQ